MAAVIAAAVAASFSCAKEREQNLAKAQAAFDRLSLGMSKKDTCWNFGVTCDDESPDLNYAKDFGMSFSKKEYQVTIWVRGDRLVRVELTEPYYEGSTRISGQGKEKIIAAKGLPVEEID